MHIDFHKIVEEKIMWGNTKTDPASIRRRIVVLLTVMMSTLIYHPTKIFIVPGGANAMEVFKYYNPNPSALNCKQKIVIDALDTISTSKMLFINIFVFKLFCFSNQEKISLIQSKTSCFHAKLLTQNQYPHRMTNSYILNVLQLLNTLQKYS